MGRCRLLGILAVYAVMLGAGTVPALATEQEGSKWEDLAARKPPPPTQVSVLVLPFWARDQRHVELVRGCLFLNLKRHGFKLAPEAPSATEIAVKTDEAVKADPDREPGARIGRADAIRLGKKLGAQWVIYGEVERLQTEMHERLFRTRKVGAIDIRVAVVDIGTGEILYWRRVKDTGSGGSGFWAAKATAVERRLLTRTVNYIFDDMAKALPKHTSEPEVTEDAIQEFVQSRGQ